MLGPVRFNHIETCTREACRAFRLKDELEEVVATLKSLDDILATLRAELAATRRSAPEGGKSSNKPFDYSSLMKSSDLEKAKRLVSAREKAIQSVKSSIQQEKDRIAANRGGDDVKE